MSLFDRGTSAASATTAFLTDRYEVTMLEAALRSGRASAPATFEVFTRRLADRRPWGVFAGLGRLVEAIERFRFGPPELDWLERNSVVNGPTLEWLSTYRFCGHVDAYREGELYTAGSPVLTVEGTFGESVLLETIVLSILNFDSAVAAAASLITCAAGQRPVIEMGSRRIDPSAAIAAARAAYLAGFATTSNLEAGRLYGIPTAGTASHAFVLAYPSEKAAFQAQIGRQTGARAPLHGFFVPQDALADALRKPARRLAHPTADEIDDRFGKRDLAALIENVLGRKIVGNQEQSQVAHRFRGGRDLHDIAQQLVHLGIKPPDIGPAVGQPQCTRLLKQIRVLAAGHFVPIKIRRRGE